MTWLPIPHRTTCRHRQPVVFGPHRLMLRPLESRDLRLIAFEVTVTPEAKVTWAPDVPGNALAPRPFASMEDKRAVDSVMQIERSA